MRRLLIGLAGSLLLLPLQGCLLDYFFAPKLAAGELPSDPQIEPLRTAYVTQCGRCHLLINPKYFDREHPIDKYTARYLAAKLMTLSEADEAAAYIRILSVHPATAMPMPSQTPTSQSPNGIDLQDLQPPSQTISGPQTPQPSGSEQPVPMVTPVNKPVPIPLPSFPPSPAPEASPTPESSPDPSPDQSPDTNSPNPSPL